MMMKTEVMKLNTITIFPANIVRKMLNFRSFHLCVDFCALSVRRW